MLEEPFSEGTSPLHRMDGLSKIIAALLIIPPAATTKSFLVAAGYILLALILATIAHLPFMKMAKRLAIVNSFTIFLAVTLPLTFGGEQFSTSFLGLTLSKEGVNLALLITMKTNSILITMIALLSTSTITAIGYGLEKLGLPLRLCYLILFTYRYIFVIEQEFKRLLRAARMRCFSPSTNIHTYRTFGYLIGMTLVKSWEQAHRVHQAMILRGFTGRFIPLSDSRMKSGSYFFIASVAICSISLSCSGYLI